MTIGENIEVRTHETILSYIEFVSEDGSFLGDYDIKFNTLNLFPGVTEKQELAIKAYAKRLGWKEEI